MMNATASKRGIGRLGRLLVGALCASTLLVSTVESDAQMRSRAPRGAQDDDRPQPNQTRPLPEIVARVQATPPYSGMDYIGLSGFEARTMVYVLRFLDGRQVVIVHVDARSGRILGRTP